MTPSEFRKVIKVPSVGYWCTVCLRKLEYTQIWLADDLRDNRNYCYDCAPQDAVREVDRISSIRAEQTLISFNKSISGY